MPLSRPPDFFLQEKAEKYEKSSGALQKKGIWYHLQSTVTIWQPPCDDFYGVSGQFLMKVFPFP